MRRVLGLLSIVLIGVVLTSGCITIYAPATTQPSAQEPLIGEWQMIRASINPAIPFPDLLVNQLIPDRSTWKIIRESNGLLKISYDGRDTWYNTLGVSVDKKPTTATEGTNHYFCNFSSTGSMYIDKVPSLPGVTQRMEQVSITYDDNVLAALSTADKMTGTITINIQGKYYGEMEIGGGMKWKTIDPFRSVVTYNGTRK